MGKWSLISDCTMTVCKASCTSLPPWPIRLSLPGTGPRFNIKMPSYQYRKSHCEDKTVVRSSYLHNGTFYTDKTSSLYWIGALVTAATALICKLNAFHLGNVPLCVHIISIWARSRNCGCLVTWFCYQLIAKSGNKTAAVSWPDPYSNASINVFFQIFSHFYMMTSSIGNISALPTLCAGIHMSPLNFPTMASDAELWCFLSSVPE